MTHRLLHDGVDTATVGENNYMKCVLRNTKLINHASQKPHVKHNIQLVYGPMCSSLQGRWIRS